MPQTNPGATAMNKNKSNKSKSDILIEEHAGLNPARGLAAYITTLHKPGYRFVKMERRGTNAKVYYERIIT
jgi:hypothetical protein